MIWSSPRLDKGWYLQAPGVGKFMIARTFEGGVAQRWRGREKRLESRSSELDQETLPGSQYQSNC